MDSKSTSDLEEELSTFRQQWRQDLALQQSQEVDQSNHNLTTSSSSSSSNSRAQNSSMTLFNHKTSAQVTNTENIENKAKTLFLNGVSLERQGKMPEAIYYYRQAIQLQPDIESKITDFGDQSPQSEVNSDFESFIGGNDDDIEELEYRTNISEDLLDVVEKFDKLSTKGICVPAFASNRTHISSLPAEVIMYIFKWVVSTTLDLQSLEQLARVCKGFYALARDPEIWRLACIRIWGRNVGNPVLWSDCWRRMFLERTRLLYNGVYISKISYVRASEPTFQLSYTPYQLVIYYRYLRFFMDGSVLFYTSPEEPQLSINKLSQKNNLQSGVWQGNYQLLGNNVSIVTQRNDHIAGSGGRRRQRNVPSNIERFYHLDLQVQNAKKKRNNRLAWIQYYCQTFNQLTGQTSVSDFDLSNQFTSFYFSRVRSFEPVSQAPLELEQF